MAQDEIFDIIEKERKRQVEGLELIASENYVSDNVLKAAGSILTNKYAEGYPGRRYYGGCEFVDQSETLAIDRLKKLFGAGYVNVQPHSGSQANQAVYLATLKPGDSILGLDLSHGGHLTHGSPVSSSGILYDAHFYGVHRDSGTIDYEAMRQKALEVKPKMIIAGASAYTRDMDFKKFREVADEVGALLMADIAHPAGLIARGLLNNPMEHCDFVTSTTHKTLRGPRGGIIMMGKDFENPWGEKTNKGDIKMMSNLLNMAVFPGTQGGPLEHIIAAKAVAFGEALTDGYLDYISQVQKNAAAMAEGLTAHGYDLVSGGTDNHLILVDLRNKNITGREAEKVLEKAHITCNKNMVPFDDKSPFTTSGIRLGSPAVTTRGLKEADMETIADLIDEALMNKDDEKVLAAVGNKVVDMMGERPLFQW